MTIPHNKIELMVWALYSRILLDSELYPYFMGVHIPRVVEKQIVMFKAILSGGKDLPDYDIKGIHSRLNVKNSHFNRLAGHVESVLRDFEISEEDISKTMTIISSYRDEVVSVIDDEETERDNG